MTINRSIHRPAARRSAALLAVALFAAAPLAAAPREYALDPVHSRVVFSVDHQGFSQAIGTFSAPRGRLRFDPTDWSSAEVEVEIAIAGLDLGDADWNRRMQRRDAFDSEHHPLARFRSITIEPIDAQHARVHGELSLRGQTAPVTLEVRLNRVARNPLTLRRTAGFSASATLSRSAFGMNAWRTVGDAVQLRIEVEALRSGRRPRQAQEPADAPAQ
jgi:polyisoprenoid-binding protein YceI